MHPLYASRKFFIRYSLASGVFFASAFAYYFYDPHKGRDKHFSLPHLKPYPAMVAKEYLHPADREAMEYHSVRFTSEKFAEEFWNSNLMRVLLPNSATHKVMHNPYADERERELHFNHTKNYHNNGRNNFRSLLQE